MSPQQHSLEALIAATRKERNSAAKLLASERARLQELLTQLELLERYRQEYSQGLQEVMTKGIPLTTLQDYQRFLASLDDALLGACSSMNEQQQRIQHCQQIWQQEQRRLSSYVALAKRLLQEQQRSEQRQELRQSDEISTNTFTRKHLQTAAAEQDTNEESS